MKSLYHLAMAASLLLPLAASAQEEMAPSWLKNPDHSIVSTGLSTVSGNYSYAASQKEISVYDNKSGEVKWSKKFSEITPKLGKVDDIIPMWDAHTLILADRKMGKDQLASVNVDNGQLLWVTDKYQNVSEDNIQYLSKKKGFLMGLKDALVMIDSRSGELLWQTSRFKGAAAKFVETDDNHVVVLNYKAGSMAAFFAGFKNQIVKINLANGEVAWEQTYRGKVERKIVTREVVCNLDVAEGNVILSLNGMQVYDYATGQPKWSAAFDETPRVIKQGLLGGASNFGAYGTVANPVIDGDFIYMLDFQNKRKQYIKKYNRHSGELIWTSPEIEDARAVPEMYLHKGVIVLQVGGTVEIQYIRTVNNGSSTTTYYVVDFDEYGPYNLQGFDATTGKQIWQSEKLKKGVSNSFMDGDEVFVCSDRALYSMNYATGKENWEVPLKKDNIGHASYVLNYADEAVIVGEKGVSVHKKADGILALESNKYKRATPVRINGKMIYGSSLALRNGDGDYAVYNLDTGSYRKYDGRANASAMLSDDGSALYVFESGGMMRKSKVSKFATK